MTPVADLGLGHVRVFEERSDYLAPAGMDELRYEIATLESVAVQNVCVTSGASMAITATLSLLPRPGTILCPKPYFPGFPRIIQALGFDLLYYDTRKLEASGGGIEISADTRAIIINSPHNPTGQTLRPEVIDQVVACTNCIVLLDAVYEGFVYDEVTSAWRPQALCDRVVRCQSFSKSLSLAGERIGYTVASAEMAARIARAHWALAMSAPASGQCRAVEALQMNFPLRLAETRRMLKERRDRAVEVFRSHAGQSPPIPPAGLFLWLEFEGEEAIERSVCADAQAKGVTVMPGAVCGSPVPAVRASFAVPEAEVERGFTALGKTIRDLQVRLVTDGRSA